jgi:polyhydroxyalkanoate synthesis regulator phasin
MAIENIEEQPLIFTEEAEAELSNKMKKLLLEVIDKGRINLEHGTDILSEVIVHRPATPERQVKGFCKNCNSYCRGCDEQCLL